MFKVTVIGQSSRLQEEKRALAAAEMANCGSKVYQTPNEVIATLKFLLLKWLVLPFSLKAF